MRIIVTDFFGVVVSEVLPIWFTKLFGEEEGMRLKHKYASLADSGEIDFDELVNIVAKDFNLDNVSLKEEWLDLAKPNDEVVEVLKQIKDPIILLSNAPKGLVEDILAKYNLTNLFNQIIISYQYKISKPDKRIYELVYKYYKKDNEFIFIDDNLVNLTTPKDMGWKTIHFENNEKSMEVLKGILWKKSIMEAIQN